jgi:hypothetical protein
MNDEVFNSVFWLAVVGSLSGFILKLISIIFKSKCKEVSCCCMKIIRDVELEEKQSEFELTHPQINIGGNPQ